MARGARGTAVGWALSMRPAASGIGHGSNSCRRRGEIAVCLVLPRVQFRNALRALRGLAGGAVLLRTSCPSQFRRVRPAGPCLRASELHSMVGGRGALEGSSRFLGLAKPVPIPFVSRTYFCTNCDNRICPHAVGLLAKMSAPRRPNRPDSRHGRLSPRSKCSICSYQCDN